MEGDEPDSDYPSSITGLSQESPSQITSVPSQEQNEESIKSKDTEKEKSKQDGDAIMANNEVSNILKYSFIITSSNKRLCWTIS